MVMRFGTNGTRVRLVVAAAAAMALASSVTLGAQAPDAGSAPAAPAPAEQTTTPSAAPATDASGRPLPADYVIGPNDVLTVKYWRDDTMSAEVAVRPDGKISLPLINDVQAAGLTPDVLRQRISEAASRYVEAPVVSVNVKEIKSRKVFITGQVGRPGEYPLVGPTTVLQLIAIAGGLHEFADSENIVVLRPSQTNFRGDPFAFRVNYKEITRRRNLQQNIELKPGDTILVP
jgi:polysaccharide export outer membrane protein